jgi:hypothetical protein
MLQCGFLPVRWKIPKWLYRKSSLILAMSNRWRTTSALHSHLLNMKYFLKNATPETLSSLMSLVREPSRQRRAIAEAFFRALPTPALTG